MIVRFAGKLIAVLALTIGLAGCIDATMDVEITSATTATATMTQVMDKSIYDMIQSGTDDAVGNKNPDTQDGKPVEPQTATKDASITSDFCAHGTLTVGDKTVTCTIRRKGDFAAIDFGADKGRRIVKITQDGPDRIRVAFPTADMIGDLASDKDKLDAETRAMLKSMFQGHTITIRVSGGNITATNMTLAEDKQSAEQDIQFMDLIDGEADLPTELYAVVKK